MTQKSPKQLWVELQAGYYTELEKKVLSHVKEKANCSRIYYTSLLDLFPGDLESQLLHLMFKQRYFKTDHLVLPDIAANPRLLGLDTRGENRLQELLAK